MVNITVEYYRKGAQDEFPPDSIPKRGNDPYYEFTAYDGNTFVGSVWCCKTRWGFWETHSELNYTYRGRGYGIYLYGYAIEHMRKNGHTVRSSTSPSALARRLWESSRLAQRFDIHYNGSRYQVNGLTQRPSLAQTAFGKQKRKRKFLAA